MNSFFPLLSAAVTVQRFRALTLAASVAYRHIADDPVRAVILASRVLPARLRGLLVLAGPYGRAAALWGAGDRRAALGVLEARPTRLAAFSLAVDQPQVARSALARVADGHPARPRLLAGLARREGQLTEAVAALDDARASRARRVLTAARGVLDPESYTLPPSERTKGRGAAWTEERSDEGRRRPKAPEGERTHKQSRVLHIVTDALPTTNAGYTVRTQEVALAQRAVGLDPHVMTRLGFPVTSGKLDARPLVTVDGVAYHRLLPWIMPRYEDDILEENLRRAADLTARLRPVVLHAASNYINGSIGLALRSRYGLPLVYEVRGFWEDTWLSRHPGLEEALRASEAYRLTRELETRAMTEADLVVTLGEAMRAEIVSRGVPADRILLAPNGVASSFLEPLPAPDRAALGIGSGEFVVGLVSSLVAHEGIGTLLSAAAQLPDLPVTVLIVGDGPERAALERQAAELGVNAVFTGRVPPGKVRDYHAILDVFVVPRTPDRVCQLVTPLKPVEAMASALPVVVSDVMALAELITDGETGLLTPPGDAGALASRLRRLRSDPELAARLGRAAHDWVAKDRTWAHNAERYRAAYQRLGAVT
jgi:glycosyltransferase involved in cell wall biosynthesis